MSSRARAERRLLLLHYPKWPITCRRSSSISSSPAIRMADRCGCRFTARSMLPWGVGRYDWAISKLEGGPLYVNAGIGTYHVPLRFNCRPELTVVTM